MILLLIILWKNLVLIKRHYITTIVEIVLPLLLVAIILAFNQLAPNQQVDEQKHGKEKNLGSSCRDQLMGHTLFFCPNTGFGKEMGNTLKNISNFWKINSTLTGAKDEEQLDALFTSLPSNKQEMSLGFVFEDTDNRKPKVLDYTVKVPSHAKSVVCSQLVVDFAYMNVVDSSNTSDLTYESLNITAGIQTEKVDTKSFTYILEEMPSPRRNQSPTLVSLGLLLPIFLGLAYTIIVTLIASVVLDNKCSGVTELLKIMGVKRWVLWVSWILRVLMVQMVVVVFLVILLKVHITGLSPILMKTDSFLLYIFILLYVLAMTCCMFAITTIFFSGLWGGMAVFFVNLVSLFTIMSVKGTSTALQWGLVFLPNGALFYGTGVISKMEIRGLGSTWSNLHSAPGLNSSINMLGIIMILILETVLYFLLAYYIEAVRKGPYGMPEPWYYPINKLMQMRKNKVDVDRTESQAPGKRPSNYEQPSKSDQPGISIQNLRKVFPATNTVAVDGVNIDFYKGQITVLLGHNGAGKTTMMDIIAGMGMPTSGTVLVNGIDIRTDLEKVRKSLGLCMQKNIVYNNLTVMENLTFVGLIKGKSWKVVRAEADEMMKLMTFENRRNTLPNNLSGGQKRKLCLCVALIAGSEVVILDEPTSGLDPEARRVVWDVLLAMRGQRTILITTHYMEEADALADKIAIMDHGKAVCYGTSLYLKNKYGGGFKMSIIIESNSNVNKITKMVESFVSGSELKSRLGAQLNYLLPASNKGQFADLFDSLQKKKDELGIISMGVSAATLDEVFLAVGMQASTGNKDIQRSQPLSEQSLHDRVTGMKLMWQQFIALLYKKLLYMARKWVMTIIVALLPILVFFMAFALTWRTAVSSGGSSGGESVISLSSAGASDPQVSYSAKSDAVSTDIGRQYKAVAESQGASLTDFSDEKDFHTAMLNKAYENPQEYMASVIAAGEINVPKGGEGRRVTAFYNGDSVNDVESITVLLMNNAILRYRAKSSDYSIKVRTSVMQDQAINKDIALSHSVLFLYITLTAFVGIFMWLPHAERVSSGKQIQVMTGAGVIIYWLTIFLLDFLLYMIVLTLLLITFVACDVNKYYSGSAEMGTITLVLLLYGIAQIPIVYLFSLVGSRVTRPFFGYMMIHVLFFLLSFLDDFLAALQNKTPKKVCDNLPVPQYVLGQCFPKFLMVAFENNKCNSFSDQDFSAVCTEGSRHPCCINIHQPKIPFIGGDEKTGLSINLWRMVICMAIYWGLFIIIESGVIGLLFSLVPMGNKQTDEDDDVKRERERVQERERNRGGQDILVAKDLAKTYGCDCCAGKFAVKGVTFGVLPGECFGLLGTNGAGKTTTFKMLTAGVIPSRGTARINQFQLKSNRGQYMKQIGYCPQEDPILEVLTGRQMLVLFAQLRGIPRDKTHQHVDMWVQQVGLSEYERRPCGTYSGGNKRKLSTALALIGDPPIVFLDEPTAGIDPVARRAVWGILTSIQKKHNCIVLTSHSMDECEALCNRLSIQVKGELKCIGSIPHLKQKFGKGFTVTIKLKDTKGGKSDVDKLKTAFVETFSPCDLKDEHSVLLQYHITNPDLTWKFLFQNMESLKDRMPCIDDYTVSETSLDEIFLSFAKASKKKKKDTK